MRRLRSSDCGDLLEFDEVRRRLQLGTRVDVGVQEIAVAQIIGSVSRAHEFDACFRPRNARLRKLLTEIKAANPNVADSAIVVNQVDHAYFVVDGHKRLSLAIEEGRESIDAEVRRIASRFHVTSGTTMEQIRFTQREHRFRQLTGLDVAVPDARFPLGEADGYLDLEESVKAHSYDLSKDQGPARASRRGGAALVRPRLSPSGGDCPRLRGRPPPLVQHRGGPVPDDPERKSWTDGSRLADPRGLRGPHGGTPSRGRPARHPGRPVAGHRAGSRSIEGSPEERRCPRACSR